MNVSLPPIENMNAVFDVRGKNVVVTGGNRGIGLGISAAFAQSGCNVAILCRNLASGEEAAAQLRQYGTDVFAVQCDASSMDSVKAADLDGGQDESDRVHQGGGYQPV